MNIVPFANNPNLLGWGVAIFLLGAIVGGLTGGWIVWHYFAE